MFERFAYSVTLNAELRSDGDHDAPHRSDDPPNDSILGSVLLSPHVPAPSFAVPFGNVTLFVVTYCPDPLPPP